MRDTSGPVAVLPIWYSVGHQRHLKRWAPVPARRRNLMHSIVGQEMPPSMASDWTELMYLQLQAGNTAYYAFGLAVALFFWFWRQYESWTSPWAIILVVLLCLLCSIVGVQMERGSEVTIFTQIGFIVVSGGGLASKERDSGCRICPAAAGNRDTGYVRLSWWQARTAFASDLDDVVRVFHPRCAPAGDRPGRYAEMRRSLGVAVFSGMLGVTLFGIFLTPVFYYLIQRPLTKPPDQSVVSGEQRAGQAKDRHNSKGRALSFPVRRCSFQGRRTLGLVSARGGASSARAGASVWAGPLI